MSLLKGPTLNRRGITSWSVVNPLGISVVDGPGIDPSGATDSSAAVQALFDALPASGGAVHFPSGNFWVEGIVCAKPVAITGNGGLLIGDGGLSPIRAATTLVSKSTTGHCLTLAAIGSSVRDLALVNEAGTVPTAGTGIKLAQGSQAYLDHVTVLGFWNDVEVSGVYWQISSCHLYDPVSCGLLVNNVGAALADHADAGITNCAISMMYRTYNADAGIRWINGGGVRINGCKINGGAQPGNSAGRFAYGIDISPSTTTLVDININGNSVANFTTAGIRLTQTDVGQVKWFNITANQINVGLGTSSVGVLVTAIDDAHVNQVANGLIAHNVLTNLQGLGISVERAKGVHVGENRFDAVAGVQVRVGFGTVNGASPIGISVSTQNTGGQDNLTLIEDWRDYGSANGDDGLIEHNYSRPFAAPAINTDQTLYRVGMRRHGAALIRVTLSGYNWSSGRYYVIEQLRALTRTGTGTVTVTSVGTDVAVGTAAVDITITYDTATVAGEVAVKAKATNATFPSASAKADLTCRGTVQMVKKGA